MSIAGGLSLAVDRAVEVRTNVLQIFVKNASRWEGKVLTDEEVEAFVNARNEAGLASVAAHDSYLINLATPDDALWERSVRALRDEMERCARLGVEFLVAHPGAHLNSGESEGVARIVQAVNRIHDELEGSRTRLVLETTAGQGTSIGCRFEHFRDILAGVKCPGDIGICLDTCHVFAAGYDIRSQGDYLDTVADFDRLIGLDKLVLFHFNDSKKELGSRVDRHEHIGKGYIGKDAFKWILADQRFLSVPKILETPKGKGSELDKRNLKVLRSLAVSE